MSRVHEFTSCRQTLASYVHYNIIQVCHFISKFSFRFVNITERSRASLKWVAGANEEESKKN